MERDGYWLGTSFVPVSGLDDMARGFVVFVEHVRAEADIIDFGRSIQPSRFEKCIWRTCLKKET